MNYFRIYNRDTLRRAAVYLLLNENLIRILSIKLHLALDKLIFITCWLRRQVDSVRQGFGRQTEELIKEQVLILMTYSCIEKSMSWSSSISREHFVLDCYLKPSIFIRMIVRTMKFIAGITNTTSMNLVVQRMILLFFPTMSASTSILILAAINCIILDKSLSLPVLALFLIIIIKMWLSPIVLPIVSIDT